MRAWQQPVRRPGRTARPTAYKAFCVFSDSDSGAPWIPSRMVRILVSSETDCASNRGPNGVAAYTIPARIDTGCFVASSSLSLELSRNAALGLDTIAYLH